MIQIFSIECEMVGHTPWQCIPTFRHRSQTYVSLTDTCKHDDQAAKLNKKVHGQCMCAVENLPKQSSAPTTGCLRKVDVDIVVLGVDRLLHKRFQVKLSVDLNGILSFQNIAYQSQNRTNTHHLYIYIYNYIKLPTKALKIIHHCPKS